jgi:hypothetical protein
LCTCIIIFVNAMSNKPNGKYKFWIIRNSQLHHIGKPISNERSVKTNKFSNSRNDILRLQDMLDSFKQRFKQDSIIFKNK